MIRTHEAGVLREEDAGQTVTLTGWVARRRDHGGVAFLDLRDGSGVAQVVVRESEIAHDLRNEYCVRVVGEVRARPEGSSNPSLPTGAVEVAASEVEVLSTSAPLPFQLDDDGPIGDEVRLRYRYLDLRRSGPAAALRTPWREQLEIVDLCTESRQSVNTLRCSRATISRARARSTCPMHRR